MSGLLTPTQHRNRLALEEKAPDASRLLFMWRQAIERGARAHARLRQMPAGPARDRLHEKLVALDHSRRAAAVSISTDASAHEGTPVDLEVIAGTAALITDPRIPPGPTTAMSADLGIGPLVFALAAIGTIVGVYAMSAALETEIKYWTRKLFVVGLVGGGAWIVWKMFKSPSRPAPPRATLGETY